MEKCTKNMYRRQSVSTLKAEGMCRLQSKRQTASREKTVWHPAVLRRMNRERGSMDKIKILKVEPGKPPCVKEIANDFKASQAEVEGDIECVGFGDGCVAVINAEGKLNGMQPNRRNGDDIICGPFFICGDTPDGDFISLTEQQIEEYTRRFGEIEQFTGQEPELEPHMTILAF